MAKLVRSSLRSYVEGVKKTIALKPLDDSEKLMLWDLRDEDCVNEWECISDEERGGGSQATFKSNKKGTGSVFEGVLNTSIKNTELKYSGYCAIRSKPVKYRSLDLMKMDRKDVSEFDAFEIRVRGDGRKFFANIHAPGLATRADNLWQYFIFTRGGPEWEDIILPFHKFFLTHRGYFQDRQVVLPLKSIATFGLLVADRVNGPFKLEIQHIKAVRCKEIHTEASEKELFDY
ncbi:PREDICTED: complex I intermediate-associated protein 30, mitochondrial-like [Amphimedon queenslandica]|uniref:NADH:ubiquinone oxidoreductase intermediate-associated protein 30 domain-containing protein n=1 Tax=Amphimedon queenslandica TaxID=400682 RepID=A0AAN0IEL5_AMPQE|nr:PREDICTED: complex I intermediate-associated protein 30, mitochondrial-like [Amphimedon queenslandica]|eukprot:XP_003387001.1 PREDICTED: complex I intermediate-associated protein 30, mitochondrial-like [Amphimedon queenslandica]